MTVMVALLRGVNVGGRGCCRWPKLREVAKGLGYDDVATYIQSGNLVLRTSIARRRSRRSSPRRSRSSAG